MYYTRAVNDKRWLLWGVAAACGALVLWRLWPELTRPATPSQVRRPRRATDLSSSDTFLKPAAAPLKVAAETAPQPELSPEEPASPETAPVHLNSSSLVELQTLPGIGPALAGRIVAARPFKSVAALADVSGIGPSLVKKLEPLVEL